MHKILERKISIPHLSFGHPHKVDELSVGLNYI